MFLVRVAQELSIKSVVLIKIKIMFIRKTLNWINDIDLTKYRWFGLSVVGIFLTGFVMIIVWLFMFFRWIF